MLSPAADERLEAGSRFLVGCGKAAEVLVIAPSLEAAARLARHAASAVGASFGWQRTTLARFATAAAATALARRGIAPAGPLVLDALCARIVAQEAAARALGRLTAIASRPGLPAALRRTLDELRLARARPDMVADPTMGHLLTRYEAALDRTRLADRAFAFEEAAGSVRAGSTAVPSAVILLDVPVHHEVERELVHAILERADRVLVTACAGDERTRAALAGAVEPMDLARSHSVAPLARLQQTLFEPTAWLEIPPDDRPARPKPEATRSKEGADEASEDAASADGVGEGEAEPLVVFSAPGESRECVEIARFIHLEAKSGVPFDRMAVLLRTGAQYRTHLAEALRRAGVPAHVSRGARRPDPSGRALLALLDCAIEGLSASRFAEYLSLGALPSARPGGAPPAALPDEERWVLADPDFVLRGMLGESAAARSEPPSSEPPSSEPSSSEPSSGEEEEDAARGLPAPRLWERLIVDAAVIGGLDRWRRRLAGLGEQLRLACGRCGADDEPAARRFARDLEGLAALEAFALPLLEALADLPARAPWSIWRDRLASLATRALGRPERVLAVLSELAPMPLSEPVDLLEVRLVLAPRLSELSTPPAERSYGKVFVGSIEEARGLSFDVVFVPGLTEKVFPERVIEDPLLGDADRARTCPGLLTNADRSAFERLALRIAAGAAQRRIYASYPRLDLEQGRPRTPSFYGLELLRAAEGKLPGFDELARRAGARSDARAGWPAPRRPELAIDDAEHDLSLLDSILRRPQAETVGSARYLLSANRHLARALRFRARRWLRTWSGADGLVDPGPQGKAALAEYAVAARAYSPTALELFAVCPYKFFLHAVHRLAPRREPVPIDEVDPLTRGAILHAAQYELYGALRGAGLLPVTSDNLRPALDELEQVFVGLEARFREELAPSIARVWDDAMAEIKADLRESLRREASAAPPFAPLHFELGFGLGETGSSGRHDPASRPEPVELDCGLRLRGSIDRVEQSAEGMLRVTDYKSGKAHASGHPVIGNGELLQPVLYALALEKMTGGTVVGGRLYYATLASGFAELFVPLDERAREAAAHVAETIRGALSSGFLPAAPRRGACERCEYQVICGPYEEQRAGRKRSDRLAPLEALRSRP